jgi:hypothetical protein
MKNFLHFLAFTFFSSIQLFGVIVHAPDLDVIERQIDSLDENALVIFDVDCTLIAPKDRILGPCGEQHLFEILKKINLSKEEAERLKSIVLLQGQSELLDARILNLLDLLKQKNIKVIALTALTPGKVGTIPDMEAWRIQQLASLGIYLEYSFPELSPMIIEGFGKPLSVAPAYRQGVISSADYPKGQVLSAFLRKINCRPSKILFVDDTLKQVESVENELNQENIEHVSFHYTAAKDRPCQLDELLADFQVEYLSQHDEWLGEDEARDKMMTSGLWIQ